MKVFNLRCAHEHGFEGWFASEEDYMAQAGRGQVECPLCANATITRLPSAPRLNVSRQREATPAPAHAASTASGPTRQQAHWMRAMRRMLDNTEDVGERFPEEARRIHYGEAQERGIRGSATPEDADALREEGIEVVALRVPDALKGPLQ